MKIESIYYQDEIWHSSLNEVLQNVSIVFTFGQRDTFKSKEMYVQLKQRYPHAHIVGCTSSGNIQNDCISNAPMVASAISFESSTSKVVISIKDFTEEDDQKLLSHKLIDNLPKEDLQHVYILSDGLSMNGSSLVKGSNEALNHEISITGGLAGDDEAFEETWVIADDVAKQNRVVAVGFYGESLSIKSGCFGGWNEFGVTRRITKSVDNIVYEVDGQPALDLYKKYLGEHAKDLPGSGLRFPFSVRINDGDTAVTRSVLAINEEENSLIFAGDVPEGSLARLMKTSIDDLIEGAEIAAKNATDLYEKSALCLVVSCVGRRLVLNQLADEEVEGINDILGDKVSLIGFYSYGELAPFSNEIMSCQLHNQTLTLTVIYED